VVEEAPSAILTPEVREAMGKAAVGVAKACNYYGAGTVEFIVDDTLNFYFLEMNTRLQVEHPVTEEITGKDLVREQIYIAEGKPLSFSQEDLEMKGHAIEVRVYAENPANNFLPDTGTLHTYQRPQGPGVRVDDGFEQGMEIPIFYDPMIAKLITYADTREHAIKRMIRAIDEYHITGIETTLPFCRFVMEHEAFTSGQFNTRFVEKYFTPEALDRPLSKEEEDLMAALAAHLYYNKAGATQEAVPIQQQNSKWKERARY
jgi:acetyl/propionyl-CoA carboxylase alpha subunit